MSTDAHSDVIRAAAGSLDRRQSASDVEAAIGTALARNARLRGHSITVTAGPEGLVTLPGTVPTQALRREVELWTLHDHLVDGR
jgi:osmotically-inducible protein OsmY